MLFRGCSGVSWDVPGVFRGLFRAVPGCSGGVPGVYRGVPGVFRGVPGVFRGVPGSSGRVPGFTDTRKVSFFEQSNNAVQQNRCCICRIFEVSCVTVSCY